MTGTIFRQEWRLLLADRSLVVIAVLATALTAYGVINGSAAVQFEQSTLASARAEQTKRTDKLRADLESFERGTAQPTGFLDPRGAASIGNVSGVPYVVIPPAPLAAFSIGQGDLYPYYFKAGLRSRTAIVSSDEIENPVNLLSGRFDLAFTIVFLFPLLTLALSYNLLSAEKEDGTLGLALSQPVSLAFLVARKAAFRALFLVGLIVVLALFAALLSGVDFRSAPAWMRLVLWIGAVVSYGAFWFCLAVVANALGKSSATNAFLLTSAWLLLVLIVPTAINLLAGSLYPVPSRVEMIQAMREASQQATDRGSILLARYYEDHPDLSMTDPGKAPDFASKTYAVQIEVDRVTKPVLDGFDAQAARQQSVVENFRFLSPAILMQEALNDISGTGIERYRNFLRQFDGFLTQWQGFFFRGVFERKLFHSDDLPTFPQFRFGEEATGDVAARVAVNLAGIILLTVLLAGIGLRLLRRYPVAG